MQYSQKYSLVAFLNPQEVGVAFDMTDWPLHITLADVFAIDRKGTGIDDKLHTLLATQSPVEITATHEAVLGTTPVVLVEKAEQLINLHNRIIDLLESCDAVFNSPEFTRDGFLPRCVRSASIWQQGYNQRNHPRRHVYGQ